MEYCPSSLLEKIKNKMLTEEEIIILIEQITLALKLMHNSNMVHLDIKPGKLYKMAEG